ncbi:MULTISPECIES: grasp-with-spasm system ATP-grasp peptide maturase [unclassified Chryseobacterium]|uniref:grasp-with-spasm system ATP-grasp peptide maturase n=1 Tax=unclassified Chryseobacterium TaxID=2593645 RepID=UPI00100A2805|nr:MULTISPECIES: grasp-with-spasm system ATP-grasp peptide maturase [unclassified Chryseobacterium]RXM50290.1 grasp-with-spasm system ATP-grasp peptide maturase [Chryseobacterium sp. CH25]RXM62517.1 grasp-with-spasm system ATP-grasp peptide maturase [Chryseobacterium sp. CH1]
MILIISENKENTTNEVIKYLLAMNKKFIRVHEDEVFEIKTDQKRLFLVSHRNRFYLDEINSIWYRNGGLNFRRLHYKNESINLNMNEYQHWLEDYVRKTLESKKHINKESNSDLNKLLVLEQAKKVGLDVPDYFLADNTDEVEFNKTIIKTIGGNPRAENIFKDTTGMMYTSIVKEPQKGNFFITFFQEKIEKDFEIRSFYLNGKVWSTAIFSQNDEQTKVDFRKYNHKRPNRNVPYQLPKSIEEKIHLLMLSLDLNCGSLDLIKSKDTFYFLEVNAIGQFLGHSVICNYSLEKEIANYL